MKSEKAQKYIGDNECTYPKQGYVTTRTAEEAVELAENEAYRRYEAVIKSLLMAHIEDINELSRKFYEILDARLKAEREKETAAFCDACVGGCPGVECCKKLNYFIKKLNANDPRVTV